MSVSYWARTGLVSGTTNVTFLAADTIPGAGGDMLVTIAASNHATNDAAVPTCAGGGTWTQLFTYVSTGGGAQGAGTGNRRVTAWYRERAATESADISVDLTGGNVMLAFVVAFRKDTGSPWSLASTNGEDTTNGTAVSITGAAGLDILPGDHVFCGWASPTSTTYSTHNLTATGLVWSTLTEQADSGTTTGNDIRLVGISAGGITSGSNAAPTVTSTGVAATIQAGYFIRLSDRSDNGYLFRPPTFKKMWDRPPMTGVGPRISFDQGVSVVRVSGILQAVQSPSQEVLQAAGTEGVDWFLGGREYTVSTATANELQAAGFTDLTPL